MDSPIEAQLRAESKAYTIRLVGMWQGIVGHCKAYKPLVLSCY